MPSAKRYSIAVRAMFYKGSHGFHVGERGVEGFPASVFAKTREGAQVIKAALWDSRRAAAELEGWCGCAPGTAIAIRKARERRAEASSVISSVLLSGY